MLLSLFLLLPYRGGQPHGAADILVAYSHVIEARMALEQGQFPIRVSPWQWEGTQYPVFQFYSPLVYAVLGGIDCVLRDPWTTIRLTLLTALILAGIGAYRLGRVIDGTEQAGLLCEAAYLLLPYIAINIQARGAIAELFGQCLLPWCALAFWSLLKRGAPRTAIWFALSMAALIHTHLITAMYFLVTCGVALLVYLALSRQYRWVPWFALGCAGAFGISAWILWPIATTSSFLVASDQTADPNSWTHLSRWWTLLTPVSISPIGVPVPGAAGLHPSLGGASLVAFVLLGLRATRQRCAAFLALGAAIVVMAFLVWSPFNVWKYLPGVLKIAQFPYRLLGQLGWLTIPALAWGMQPHRERLRDWPLVGALICGAMMLDITYLVRQVEPLTKEYAGYLDTSPTFGYAKNMYLPRLLPKDTVYLHGAPLPLANSEGLLRLNEYVKFDSAAFQSQPGVIWRLEVTTDHIGDNPVLYLLNGKQVIADYSLRSQSTTVDVPLGLIMSRQHGIVSLLFASSRGAAKNELKLESSVLLNPSQPGRLLGDTRGTCSAMNSRVTCSMEAEGVRRWWQLPILYYPGLLDVKLDGRQVEYRASPWAMDGFLTPMATIELPAGDHIIEAAFRGSPAADKTSVAFAALAAIGLVLGRVRSGRRDPRMPL